MSNKGVNNKDTFKNFNKEKESISMNKIKYIGIGAAGNKAIMDLINEGVASVDDTLLINSTNIDFPEEYDGSKLVLSTDNSGCGKERDVAYYYAETMITAGTIDKYVEDYNSIVIVTSLEGGTGSGATPIIGQYCSVGLGKTTRIYGFAGFEEDPKGMENTIGFFQQLNFDCTVQCNRNSLFKKKYKSREAVHHAANMQFCDDMRLLSGQSLIASSQNMDATDLIKVAGTVGYCIINTIEFEDTLADVDDFNKLCQQMLINSKALKSNNKQLRMGVVLNIKEESEDAIDYDFSVVKETYGNPYEVFIHKQYNGGTQYISFISAGMKFPLDEIEELYSRYEEKADEIDVTKDVFHDKIRQLSINKNDKLNLKRDNSGIGRDAFLKQLKGTAVEKNEKKGK